jgi:hypothetical protein
VWTAEGVTFGFRCSEPNPDKLKMDNRSRDDGTLWFQDCVEVFLDPSGKGGGPVAQLSISAGGGLFDAWGGDSSWTCEGLKFAKSTGPDFWSMEALGTSFGHRGYGSPVNIGRYLPRGSTPTT